MLLLCRLTILFTSLSLVSARFRYNSNPKNSYSTTVIIIGAGISGAGAAKTLTEKGVDFVVLEAGNAIGGRIKQGHMSGVNIELGANWVEGIGGPNVNPILTYALKYNFSLQDTNYDDSITLLEDGTRDETNLGTTFADVYMAQAKDLMKERNKAGLEDISLRTALSLVGWRATSPLHDCVEYLGAEEEFAGSIDQLSANYTLDYGTEKYFGENISFVNDQRGYKTIPENIFKEANAEQKIRFGTTVIEIEYNDQGVTVHTQNGDVWKAQFLISTVSLGVYQHDRIKFTPPLPSWKQEAIFKFDMEIYTKIFLDFPSKFWSDSQFTFFAASEKGYYPEFENLMAKGYFKDIAHPGSNLLMTTMTGKQAKRIERLADEEILNEIMDVLKTMYPGKEIPRATSILVPRWGQDPLFHGAFTNWPIGMSLESWMNLVAPLNRRVFFGGEMASLDYFGYVHGGYLAGIKAAEDVAACRLNICPQFKFYPSGLKAARQTVSTEKRFGNAN